LRELCWCLRGAWQCGSVLAAASRRVAAWRGGGCGCGLGAAAGGGGGGHGRRAALVPAGLACGPGCAGVAAAGGLLIG